MTPEVRDTGDAEDAVRDVTDLQKLPPSIYYWCIRPNGSVRPYLLPPTNRPVLFTGPIPRYSGDIDDSSSIKAFILEQHQLGYPSQYIARALKDDTTMTITRINKIIRDSSC